MSFKSVHIHFSKQKAAVSFLLKIYLTKNKSLQKMSTGRERTTYLEILQESINTKKLLKAFLGGNTGIDIVAVWPLDAGYLSIGSD